MANEPDTAVPRFFLDKALNPFKSQEAGHPVYDEVEKVDIIIPGQNQSIATERIKDHHRERWPNAYAAWKKGLEIATEGSPLEMWPPLTPAQVANLKVLNITTVEQLAQLPDSALSKIGMGARDLQIKAKAWLTESNRGEALSQAMAENAKLAATIETMKANYDDLASRIQRITDAQNLTEGTAT